MGAGAYRLDEVLGRGGSATVWSLTDEGGAAVTDRVAKVFESGRTTDALHRELDAYARLHHPRVLLLLDHGQAPSERLEGLSAGSAYLVLERAEATLRRRSVQRWADLQAVLAALLDALAHAHARGVMHLDVKPSNVVRAHGEWKLADFGVARGLRARGEGRVVVGTPGYMAPEQWSLGLSAAGPWSDLHALGVVGWELSTGRRPYGSGDDIDALARATAAGKRPPFEARFEVPAGFASWLDRLLHREPMARFRTAADARHALDRLSLEGAAIAARQSEPPPISDIPSPPLMTPLQSGELLVLPDSDPGPPQPLALPTRPISSVGGRATIARRARLGGLPLQGREQELALAWEALREARTSRRPVVRLFRGLAGVGTSAILSAFASLCRERGAATVLEARHQPESATDGVARAIVRHLRLDDTDPWTLPATLGPTLDAHGFEEPHERRAFVDLVASVLGADMGGMAPDREAAMVHFLRRCSARPVVMVLEDLQWGAATLDSIGALASATDLAVLVLGSVQEEALRERPIEEARLDRLQHVRTHRVEPLADGSMARWLGTLFELDPAALETLVRRAEGLPQRALALGLADRDTEDSPEALWLAYADALCPTDEERGGLEVAAALGVDIRPSEHEATIARLGARFPAQAIDRLAHRALVQRDRVGWHFTQPSFRRALLERARQGGRLTALHRACADALEALYPSPPFGVLERRALHERAAGNEAAARALFLGAAIAALNDDTPRQAARLLDAAGFEADTAPMEARLTRARIHRQLGRYDEARALLDPILDEGDPSHLALHERARVAILTRDGAVDALVARLHEVLDDAEDPFVRGNLLDDLGVEAMYLGRLDEAAGHFRAAIAVFAELGDRWREGSSRLNLAGVLRRMGDLTAARDTVDDAEQTYQQAGSRSGVARVAYVRGDLARMAGELDEAERCLARGLRFVHSPADRVLLELTDGLVALDRRSLDRAGVALAAARASAEALGMHGVASCARLYEAVGAAAAGQWALASEALTDTRARLAERPYVHDSLIQYGEALASLALDAGQEKLASEARALVEAQLG